MAGILPAPFNLGGEIGKSIRTGLSGGLNTLAQFKLNEMMKRQQESVSSESYKKLGLPDISSQPEKIQQIILNRYLEEHPEYFDNLSGGQGQGQTNPMQQQSQMQGQQAMGQLGQAFRQPQGPTNANDVMANAMQQQLGMQQPATMGATPSDATSARYGYIPRTRKEKADYFKFTTNQEMAKQKDIKRDTKGFRKDLQKLYQSDVEIKESAQKALSLISTGKTRAGIASYAPLWGAGKETRELAKIYSELAGKKAAEGGGIQSRARIRLAEAQKPSLDMPIEAQEDMLRDIINTSKKRGLAMRDIARDITRSNNGVIPENYEDMVYDQYRKLHPDMIEDNQQPAVQGSRTQAHEEDFVDQLARVGGTTAAKVGQGAITGLGNLAQAGAGLTDYVAGKFDAQPNIGEAVRKYSPLPTSESVSKRLSQWTNGKTNPQSTAEEYLYNIAELFGSMFMPGAAAGKVATGLGKIGLGADKASKVIKYALPFSGSTATPAKMLAAATAGETARSATEVLGGGSASQILAQGAAMLATGSAGTRAKTAEEALTLMDKARKGFGDIKVDSRPTINSLREIKQHASRTNHPYAKELSDVVDEVIGGIEKSQETQLRGRGMVLTYNHRVVALIDAAKNINSRYGWSLEPKISGAKFTPAEMRPALGKIVKTLDETIARAAKLSPEAEEAARSYFTGKDIYKALNTHSKTVQFFIDNADISSAFAAHHSWPSTIFNLIKGTVAYTGRDISKVESLLKTTVGRNAYLKAIKSAAMNDRNGFIRSMTILGKISSK
jgi:hypothetical protein